MTQDSSHDDIIARLSKLFTGMSATKDTRQYCVHFPSERIAHEMGSIIDDILNRSHTRQIREIIQNIADETGHLPPEEMESALRNSAKEILSNNPLPLPSADGRAFLVDQHKNMLYFSCSDAESIVSSLESHAEALQKSMQELQDPTNPDRDKPPYVGFASFYDCLFEKLPLEESFPDDNTRVTDQHLIFPTNNAQNAKAVAAVLKLTAVQLFAQAGQRENARQAQQMAQAGAFDADGALTTGLKKEQRYVRVDRRLADMMDSIPLKNIVSYSKKILETYKKSANISAGDDGRAR